MKKSIFVKILIIGGILIFTGCGEKKADVIGNYNCSGSFGGGNFSLSETGKLKGVVFGDNKIGTWEKFDNNSIIIKGLLTFGQEAEFKVDRDNLIMSGSSVQLDCKKQ